MRLVLLTSTSFGKVCLDSLQKRNDVCVAGIVTTSEEVSFKNNSKRIKNYQHIDFNEIGKKSGIPVFQKRPDTLNEDISKWLKEKQPDYILVCGWYYFVPKTIRDVAPCLGLHASLLPDYSGWAPLVWALINGEETTGVTLFKLDQGIDSGPILAQEEIKIKEADTIKSLYSKVEDVSVLMINSFLDDPGSALNSSILQEESKRKVYPMRTQEDGDIDWKWDARRVFNFVRAQTYPYPGAFTLYKKNKIIIWECQVREFEHKNDTGQIRLSNDKPKRVLIMTGDNKCAIELTKIGSKYGEIEDATEYFEKNDIPYSAVLE